MTTMLIADDETDMRMLVRIVIEVADGGLSIVGEAADGDEALRIWESLAPPVPDVVILDNRMPHRSGLEAAAAILAERPNQIIVLYSAFLDDEVRADAAAIGVARCIAKHDIDQIPAVVRELTATR